MSEVDSNQRDIQVRAMLRLQITPGKEKEFEETWSDIAHKIDRQPANLGQWLLKSNDEPGVYYIMSDWLDESRFRQFEKSVEHVQNRKRLQPYRTDSSMTTMRLVYQLSGRGCGNAAVTGTCC